MSKVGYGLARRGHAVKLSYNCVKLALQEAGLVRRPGRGAVTVANASPRADGLVTDDHLTCLYLPA